MLNSASVFAKQANLVVWKCTWTNISASLRTLVGMEIRTSPSPLDRSSWARAQQPVLGQALKVILIHPPG